MFMVVEGATEYGMAVAEVTVALGGYLNVVAGAAVGLVACAGVGKLPVVGCRDGADDMAQVNGS
jgi:hypothetical protein